MEQVPGQHCALWGREFAGRWIAGLSCLKEARERGMRAEGCGLWPERPGTRRSLGAVHSEPLGGRPAHQRHRHRLQRLNHILVHHVLPVHGHLLRPGGRGGGKAACVHTQGACQPTNGLPMHERQDGCKHEGQSWASSCMRQQSCRKPAAAPARMHAWEARAVQPTHSASSHNRFCLRTCQPKGYRKE